jgi:hypothetical protein
MRGLPQGHERVEQHFKSTLHAEEASRCILKRLWKPLLSTGDSAQCVLLTEHARERIEIPRLTSKRLLIYSEKFFPSFAARVAHP